MHCARGSRNIAKIVAAMFCLAVAFSMLLPTLAFAADQEQKTVRVGYVNVKGYEEGGDGEYKTGFGYEYFQTISYYTDWRYEYVYGSFSELIAKLSAGEIDLMGNVTATEARAQVMDFSAYPQGNETFYVYAKADRDDLVGAKPEALQGKRIGVGKNSYQSQLFDEYLASQGITAQKIELDGTREVVAALEAGTIDAAVMTDATDYGYVPVQVVGFHDYYFAVSKDRPDLLDELDAALAQIQSADPNYNTTIARKYSFGSASVNYLTKQEQSWLSAHGNTIRIGYLESNLPYSATSSNGDLAGVIKIVADELEDKFGIRVETRAYGTVTKAREALVRGEVDCFGPAYGDFYLAEQFDLIQSESLVTTTPVILYKGDLKTDVVAVGGQNLFNAAVVKIIFPDAQIVDCSSIEGCMDAVANEKADCTLITSAKLNVLHQYKIMEELSYSELLRSAELCLFANHGEANLLTILNKAIYLSSTQMGGATFVTSADSGATLSLTSFVRANWAVLLAIAVAIIAVLAGALFRILITSRRAARAEARAAASDKLVLETQHDIQELEHQITTDTLTGLRNRLSLQNDTERLTDTSGIAVLSIDVNGLKAVNDNAGHEHGDELLQTTGNLVLDVFGPLGKCYHISGDEYVVIMEKDVDAIDVRVQELKAKCAQAESVFFQVSLSIGYAKGADFPGASFNELHRTADLKMYEDKTAHYCNWVYDRRKDRASDSMSRVATGLSEYVPGGYFVYEAEGDETLLYVNSEMLNIFECTSKEKFMELVGGSFRGMVHPDDLERVEQEIADQIRSHMDLDYTEYRIITAKGDVKRVRDFGRYVTRANGTGIFYVMISEMR